MSYLLPQVLIRQLFRASVVATRQRQLAAILGPHGAAYRYAVEDEKTLIHVGQYDHVGTNVDGEWKTCFSWPEKPAGSRVDATFTKLFIDSATLRYFQDLTHTMTKTASNKIRHPSKSFADNPLDPDTYPKHSSMLDRGVKVGDIVVVKGKDGSLVEHSLCTYVKAIEGDVVAASIGAASSYAANQATAGATSNQTRAADNSGNLQITTVSGGSYSGYIDGDVEETYTVECFTPSTGGDLTTARLRVTSASGHDDVTSLIPAAAGYATAIGARGLTVTFNTDGGSDFEAGDTWTVYVRQAWTAPTATSGGTYTGTTDRTYIIEVTKGGDAATLDDPEITCTTDDGTDFSGPTPVTAVATNAAVGTDGVLVQFNQAKLRKGDRYKITVTAATTGAMRTLVLGHAMDSGIPLDDANADLEVQLFIKTNIQVPERHVSVDGNYNWTQSQTQVCALADVYAFADDWTDDGVAVALPVITENSLCTSYNKLYVECRYWLNTLASSVWTVTSEDIASIMTGPTDKDNPLKFAAHVGLTNSVGQPVLVIAVADPDDIDSWQAALDRLSRVETAYSIVPLTHNATVQAAVVAHVNSMSTETRKRFRRAWFGLTMPTEKTLVSAALSSDGLVVKATTEDDSGTSGTQYTTMRITSENAELIAAGVQAGDKVRYQFTTDAWGTESYSEYTIDEVISEDTLRLTTGTAMAETTPIKVEIIHEYDTNEQATQIGANASVWASRRISACWPDQIGFGGEMVDNMFLCAARAAISSAVFPNQSTTRSELLGFDDLSRTTDVFSETQLDTMAGNGVDITTRDASSGDVYCRHAVTTADYNDVKLREEQYTRNADSISFRFDTQFSPYIGKANAVPGMLEIIEAETKACIQDLRQEFTSALGGQLIDATIVELRISPLFIDQILLTLDCQLPAPFNNLRLDLII